jgi:hypothetical protein
MEAKITLLEQQLRSLTLGGKFKDLSLAASIREWNDSTNSRSVSEFLAQVENCATVSNWSDVDLVNIVKAKLTREALLFVNGRDELLDENMTYENLKSALLRRFSDTLPPRYYYNLLHEAVQKKDESPAQLLDRCRVLSTKTMRKTGNVIEQRVLKEEADFRLLTSFIHGVTGDTGKELRYRNPGSIKEALGIAAVAYNAAKTDVPRKEREVFTVKTVGPDQTKATGQGASRRNDRRYQEPRVDKFRVSNNERRDRVQNPVVCYACRLPGHIARFCDKNGRRDQQRGQNPPNFVRRR